MRLLFLFALLASSFSGLNAQHPLNVEIHRYAGMGYPPCEPSIAVNPLNPMEVVAGSILDNVYRSSDGGRTWFKDRLSSPHGVFGDPCVVASPSGDFYYLHLSDPAGKGWSDPGLLDRIV